MATAFGGAVVATLVGAEAALGGVHIREVLLLDQPGDEFLGEILGILGRVALPADEAVEGEPVGLGEAGGGIAGLGGGRVAAGRQGGAEDAIRPDRSQQASGSNRRIETEPLRPRFILPVSFLQGHERAPASHLCGENREVMAAELREAVS